MIVRDLINLQIDDIVINVANRIVDKSIVVTKGSSHDCARKTNLMHFNAPIIQHLVNLVAIVQIVVAKFVIKFDFDFKKQTLYKSHVGHPRSDFDKILTPRVSLLRTIY